MVKTNFTYFKWLQKISFILSAAFINHYLKGLKQMNRFCTPFVLLIYNILIIKYIYFLFRRIPSNEAQMKKIRSSFICLFLSLILFGCSKDSSNCLFIGGLWCDPATGTVCIEFRENGEYYTAGGHVSNWKTKADCNTIEFFASSTSIKLYEYKVISITGNLTGSQMVLNIGLGNQKYIKK